MALSDELKNKVGEIYQTRWSYREGQIVPEDKDISLGNAGVNLDATMLYADLSASTALVDDYKNWFAAENYKTFLLCATKIIRSEGGHIRSYDGDRVMGVFIGDSKDTSAVRCALKINWAVKDIIDPAMKAKYPKVSYSMEHVVGVDTSKVMAVRAGIRGFNDIAWIGRAANHAAKLSNMSSTHPTWISDSVYNAMENTVKLSAGKDIWEPRQWTGMSNRRIYRSSYWWPF